MISQRTQSLLDRLEKHSAHALAPVIKNSIIDAHAAAERFAAKKAELASSGTLTPRGQQQALRDALVHHHGKALARSRDPIKKAQQEIKTRREALKVQAVDMNNQVAEWRRMEARTYLCSLDPGARQSLALTTDSRTVLESILTAELPAMAGFGGTLTQILPQIEQRFLEISNPQEIAALHEMQAVVDEGEAATGVARVLMQSTSELEDHQFEQLMRPIELKIGAPWLLRRGDDVQVAEVLPDGTASYHHASPDEIAAGVYYKDFAEYKSVQGMAA